MKIEGKNKKSKQLESPTRRSTFNFQDDRDFAELIDIVKKNKQFKSPSEIEQLRQAFSQFKFFNDLEEQMGREHVNTLFKELSYERMGPRSVVFQYGDLGRKFYIILRGTVWVLVKKKGLAEGIETKEPDDSIVQKRQSLIVPKITVRRSSQSFLIHPPRFGSFTKQDSGDEEDDRFLPDDQFLEKKFPQLIKVGSMTSGANFGEIALTKQVPRTATIICSNICHFVTLTRETFNGMLAEYYEQLQHLNIKFLSQLAIFSEWNEAMLNQLYYHFTFKNFKHNQIIYKENDLANEIYLVREGEVEISKQIEIKMRDPTETEQILESFRGSCIGKFNCKYQRIKSAMITQGQMFGQDEVLAQTKRNTTAVCTSEKLVIFVLEKQVALQLFIYIRDFLLIVSGAKQLKKWQTSQNNRLSGGTLEKIHSPPLKNRLIQMSILQNSKNSKNNWFTRGTVVCINCYKKMNQQESPHLLYPKFKTSTSE